MNSNIALWGPWFSSHAGQVLLAKLASESNVYIETDSRKSHLLLYRGTNDAYLAVKELASGILQSLKLYPLHNF